MPSEPAWPEDSFDDSTEPDDPKDYLAYARARQEAARSQYQALRQQYVGRALKQEEDQRAAMEQERRAEELAEKEAIAEDLLEMLESASDAELATIGADGLEELVDLLERDD